VVVKLGSSTLVAPDGRLREEVLDARVADLVALRARGLQPVLVSSGAIALGLGRLGVMDRPSALPALQAASAVGQGELFARYIRSFRAHGAVPAQILLTSADLERRASYLNARNTLERLIEWGAVPVVNENDTTATDELTFGDNDVLAAQVAILLRARALLLLTERDGLYGPGPGGPVLLGEVPEGTDPTAMPLADMGASASGRGGIASKVAAAAMATAAGVRCVIASGTRAGVIGAAAAGEPAGTAFPAARRPQTAFKLWLRHAKPAMGTLTVDSGAARALSRSGTSLLAVGVVACRGDFAAGDAVEVIGPAGEVVGKGISALSADEVRAVAGMRSEVARRVLPDAPPEVVHRDQFVLAAGRRPE
jgi:glutamate 5-kinase